MTLIKLHTVGFVLGVVVLSACGNDDETPTTDAGADLGATDSGAGDSGSVDLGTPVDAGADLGVVADAGADLGVVADAGSDAGEVETDAGPSSDGGCAGTLLTVKNYLAWCSVSVAGGASSTAAEQTVCVPSESPTDLSATAASSSFIVAAHMWHHTDGDTGAGEPESVSTETVSATVTASGTSDCVWVCCPFPGGGGCDVEDQCP